MTIISTLPFLLQNGQTADATQVMANYDEIVDDVNNNAAHNGANNDITSLSGLTTPLTNAQGGTNAYDGGVSGGTANAQTIAAATPLGFSLVAGNRISFIPNFTNTASMTLTVGATSAKAVLKFGPAGLVALTGGEIVRTNYVQVIYDGTRYVLAEVSNTPYLGPLTVLASATSTDLGAIPNHNVILTGTATILNFGSSASLTYPVYRIKFNDVIVLTYNAALLLLPGLANITTAANDTATALYLGSGVWQITEYQKANGPPIGNIAPTTQVFTSGSGTYTPAANARWISVRLVGGGGGGGGGQNATPATTGGNTTFSTFTASGGVGGALGSSGTGGAASGGYSNSSGSAGGPPTPPSTAYNGWGGAGGASQLGGAGAPSQGNSTASAGATNTGSGGGGGGATNGSLTGSGAAGGGSGGCVLGVLAATTYSYGVGAGGAGAAGASSASSAGGAGGAGAAGKIEVVEYY